MKTLNEVMPRAKAAGSSLVDGLGDGLAPVLGGEGHEAAVAAEGRRDAAGAVVVGGHQPHAGFLLDMAMGLDPAGQDQFAGGVDHVALGIEAFRQRNDAPVADADIGTAGIGSGRHGAAPDHQIEVCHGTHPVVPSGRITPVWPVIRL
jgi:hypothetical protein